MVLQIVKSRFQAQKNFSENYLRFGHTHTPRKVRQPCPRPKEKFKEYWF